MIHLIPEAWWSLRASYKTFPRTIKKAPEIKYSTDVRHLELQKVLIAYFCGERDILQAQLYFAKRSICSLYGCYRRLFRNRVKPCWDLIHVQHTVRLRCVVLIWSVQDDLGQKSSCSASIVEYSCCFRRSRIILEIIFATTGSTRIPRQLSQSRR